MSRKRAIVSNTPQVGIFTDKKSSKYNKLILEALLSQEITAWQIAEILKQKIIRTSDKESILERRYNIQKIYSVIQRKTGRLEDLKTKGYITEKSGKYQLTRKGLVALNIIKPDLVAIEVATNKNSLLEQFEKAVSVFPDEKIESLGIQIDVSQLKAHLKKIDPAKILGMILEETKALPSEGIELDRINEEDLLGLVKGRKSFQEKVFALGEGLEK
jgi:hypothetical protein